MVSLFEMYEKTTMYDMYNNILTDALYVQDCNNIKKYCKEKSNNDYYSKPDNTTAQIDILKECYNDALEIYDKMKPYFRENYIYVCKYDA